MTKDIWTIGHSTQALEPFLEALTSFSIELLVDVRRFPHSRRHPHFNTDELKRALFRKGIQYEWLGAGLGGFRKARQASPHVGLANSSFQGYADHMESATFAKGLERLIARSDKGRVAYMCSESNYKGCHRRMISDHLQLLEGYTVHHIVKAGREVPHEAFREARVVDGRLLYAARPLEEFEGS